MCIPFCCHSSKYCHKDAIIEHSCRNDSTTPWNTFSFLQIIFECIQYWNTILPNQPHYNNSYRMFSDFANLAFWYHSQILWHCPVSLLRNIVKPKKSWNCTAIVQHRWTVWVNISVMSLSTTKVISGQAQQGIKPLSPDPL